MILRRSVRCLTATLLLTLAAAASTKELHSDTGDSVAAPDTDGKAQASPSGEALLRQPAAPGMTFQLHEQSWKVHFDPVTENLYYHNEDTGSTQWSDPRIVEWKKIQLQEASPRDQRLRWGVVATTVIAFAAVLLARLAYLQVYYPTLLWPTKERRTRKKYRNKERTPRQRFKVSQDGKGGRSANS